VDGKLVVGHQAENVYSRNNINYRYNMYESNMSVLRKQFKNGFALRKFLICVISFVTLLAISVLYTPALQDRNFLVRLLGPFKSTCSYAADRRGPNQKIISYSLYGNFSGHDHIRKYVLPLKETLNSIPLIYPGKYK
jgi:hypothetical protein